MNTRRNRIKLLVMGGCLLLLPLSAYAQKAPFAVTETHRQTVTTAQLTALENAEPKPMTTMDGKGIVLMGASGSLLVTTGPEDDNESYRIHGIRNPALVLRAGATVHLLFVNTDGDAPHDLRIGNVKPPDTAGTVGTIRLERASGNTFSAEAITIRALTPNRCIYYCSIGSHAKNGMQGAIIVLNSDATMPEMMRAQ